MRLFNALRGGDGESTDAIRQTTSLTMAYLLEQNRRFEFYMRGKVEELEARVAAQQARTSINAHNDADTDEATQSVAPIAILDETRPTSPADSLDILDFSSADFGSDEVEEFFDEPVTSENEAIDPFRAKLETEVMTADEAPGSGWTNWEAALIGMPDKPIEAEAGGATNLPAEPGGTENDLSDSLLPAWLQTNLGQQPVGEDGSEGMTESESSEPVALEDEASETSSKIATESVEESDGVDNEAETSIPLQIGPVEDWA